MPSKRGLFFHVSIHPRGGILTAQVALAIEWVRTTTAQMPHLSALVVTEASADGTRHLHAAYELNQESDAQGQKRRWLTLFKDVIEDNDAWGPMAIVVKCHPDFYQLVGGYLAKDSEVNVEFSRNINATHLREGKNRYETSLRRSKVKRTTKAGLPALVAFYYRLCATSREYGYFDNDFSWFDYTPKQQLKFILGHMIDDGYHHLLFDFTDRNRDIILSFWDNILKIKPDESENKTETNDIIDAPPPPDPSPPA